MTLRGSGDPGAYRPDVDGLRALAVAMVIAFHLKTSLVPSGFVGVDIFFVISGFVVTRSVLHSETERVLHDLLGFWKRRFLRIFPALAVVAVAALVAAQLLMPPYPVEPYHANARSALAALLGMGNLYLLRVGQDYFAGSESNLYLHTWSLGVEEQFYLVFALLFIGGRRFLPNRADRFMMVGALGCLSYLATIWAAGHRPSETYYLLTYRFWELAIGCVLAMAPPCPRLSFLRWPALLVVLATSAIPVSTGFPLLSTTSACVAVAIVIWTGQHKPIGLLSAQPVVAVGLGSYSLYLWHWPVIVLVKGTLGPDLAGITWALVLTCLLSTASYFLVERRWRSRGRLSTAAPFVAVLGACAAALVVSTEVASGALYMGVKQDWGGEWRRPTSYRIGTVSEAECMFIAGASVPETLPAACQGTGERTVLVLGDSEAAGDWSMFDPVARSTGIRLASLTHNGCALDTDPMLQPPSCLAYWKRTPDYVVQQVGAGDVVLLATIWTGSGSFSRATKERLLAIQQATASQGARLIVQTLLPALSRQPFLCTKETFRLNYEDCAVPRNVYDRRKAEISAALEGMGLNVWDPSPYICNAAECPAIRDKKPVLRDYSHLSAIAEEQLWPRFKNFAGL